MSSNMVKDTNISKDPATALFYREDGGSRFLQQSAPLYPGMATNPTR
jgi:hypothetical protein